jgi:glycosyltransferase involved in cell wall biosynthesis
MHVLLLGPYPPPHGGVQVNLVAIQKLLLARQIAVNVINLTRHRRPSHDGVYYPETGLQVVRLILATPATIIHLHIGGELTSRLLALALVCCMLPGRKTVLTFHSGGYPSSPQGQTASPWTLRGFVLRRFDRVIAINEQLEKLFQHFGVRPDRIRFILPYVLPKHVPDAELPPAIELFFRTHERVLLSMGWLEPEYDYPLQIRALARLRRTFPSAGLAIFGDGRLEKDLRALAGATGVSEHVLLAGDVPHSVALEAMARSTVFLRTTLYDGDSISVREALHLGVPVIASDNGMRPPGVTLVPMENEDAVVEAASTLLASPAAKRFTPQDGTDQIEAVMNLYLELQA